MGILDRINPNKPTIPNSVVFSLTASGKSKAEEYRGNANDKVLVSLDENGASTISEISQDTGLRRGTVEIIIRRLLKGGYIHSMKSEDN